MATYVVTIGGATTQIRPGWGISETANGVNRISCAVVSTSGTYRPAINDDIVITENGTRIFGGLIDNPQEHGAGGQSRGAAIEIGISASDYTVYAQRIALTSDVSRPSETLKARLTWIASLLSAQGVSLDAGQATGPTIDAQGFQSGQFVVDILNKTMGLANGTGSASWVWQIDYTKTMRATQAGTVAAPFNVVDGDGHALGDITIEQPLPSTYANYIILRGGSGTRDTADNFTGDGSTSAFTLTVPVSVTYGYVTMNGVFETLGSSPATWIFDPVANTITRTSPPPVSATINVTYVGQYPVDVIADGGASAANRVDKIYTEPDVFDVAVMQALANNYLTRDMDAPKTVRYSAAVTLTGIHPGMTQTITSTKRNLSGTHLIVDVQIVNIGGTVVQRHVTAVTSSILPATLREQWQQVFGPGSGGTAAVSSAVTTSGSFNPGGNDKDVQFKDGTKFGGDDDFQYGKLGTYLLMGQGCTVTQANPIGTVCMGDNCHCTD